MVLSKISNPNIDPDEIADRLILSGEAEKLLLIVPTNRKARQMIKYLTSISPNQAVGTLHVETIRTVPGKLWTASSNERKLINDSGKRLLLKQCLKEFSISYFEPYGGNIPNGTLERISAVISEYKMQGISPKDILNSVKEEQGIDKLKGESIAAAYHAYNQFLKKDNYLEMGDMIVECSGFSQEQINLLFRKVYPVVTLIMIKGYSEFSSPEIELIGKLANVPGINLLLDFDYYQDNYSLFNHLDRCVDKFRKKGIITQDNFTPAVPNKFKSKIREQLFNIHSNKTIPEMRNDMTLLRARTRTEEVIMIAKQIKTMVIKDEIKPSNICIVVNKIGSYSSIFRDIFNQYGIPLNLTDRMRVSTSHSASAIIHFFEIAVNDFYYKDLFKGLANVYFPPKYCSLSDLLQTANDLHIISGQNYWIKAINNKINEADDSEFSNQNEVRNATYRKVRYEIERIGKILYSFKGMFTPEEFLITIREFLRKAKISYKIINFEQSDHELLMSGYRAFLMTLHETVELISKEYGMNSKFSFRFFIENLKTALSAAKYNTKEIPNYGVQITTPDEIRGLQFDHLFIAGLYDQNFPSSFEPEVFSSKTFSRNERRHIQDEQYLFYQALCCWKKTLFLSYPQQDEDSELTASFFLDQFKDLFTFRELTSSDYANLIYTKQDAFASIGKFLSQSTSNDELLQQVDELFEVMQPDFLTKDEILDIISSDKERLARHNSITIDSTKLNEAALERFSQLSDRVFSITQFETYAKCPYKYFLERVLYLRKPEEPSDELDLLVRGNLLHKILFLFSTRIKEQEIVLSQCSQSVFDECLSIILSVANEEIEKTGFHEVPESFLEIELITGIAGRADQSILHQFITFERSRITTLVPEYFEYSFGAFDNAETTSSIHVEIDGIKLRGKIDRIDIDHRNKLFKVIDYKTSKKDLSSQDLADGISLQLTLYLIAVKQILKQLTGDEYSPLLPEYFTLRPGKNFGSSAQLKFRKRIENDNPTAKDLEQIQQNTNDAMEIATNKIRQFSDAIRKGQFPLSTIKNREERACKYCSFSSICRINEIS